MRRINLRLVKLLSLGFLMMILTHSLHSRYGSEASPAIHGVSPQDVNYYKGLLSTSSATINCKDGSNMFSKSQLNDDFCDCLDGSDEPGTSACPNGKFYCKNAGHTPVTLYSSRVNDGICDCCDGSDEYDGTIKCPNTCWEAGKAAREKLKKKIATYKEGVNIRNRDIEHAKTSIAKDEAELSKLKDAEKALKKLVEQLKDRKEEIEKAEEKERLQKEKEEKERIEAEKPKEKEIKAQDIEPAQTDIHNDVGPISGEDTQGISKSDLPSGEEIPNVEAEEVKEDSSHEVEDTTTDDNTVIDTDNQHANSAEDTESLSKEELGRLVASRWTGEKSEHNSEESVSAAKDVQNPDEIANEPNDDEDSSYDSEDDEHKYDDDEEHKYDDDDEHKYDDDDEHKYDGDDHSENQAEDFSYENNYDSHKPDSDEEFEFSDSTGSSLLKKIQQTARSIFTAINVFKKPVNISDAAHVRKEYDESSAKLSKMQSRISSLKQKLKQDFGPEKEFYSFYDQCFEAKQNKYVYKVCPFKQATQEEGYSQTRLGSWEKFEDSYRVMQFLNGDKCWNGPDRSLKVKLRCGLKNELSEVDEPSRCEYLALLSTPALCVDSKLKELQEKLEAMNKDQPQQGNDEL